MINGLHDTNDGYSTQRHLLLDYESCTIFNNHSKNKENLTVEYEGLIGGIKVIRYLSTRMTK